MLATIATLYWAAPCRTFAGKARGQTVLAGRVSGGAFSAAVGGSTVKKFPGLQENRGRGRITAF